MGWEGGIKQREESKEGIHESLSGRVQKKNHFYYLSFRRILRCLQCLQMLGFLPLQECFSLSLSIFLQHDNKIHLKMKECRKEEGEKKGQRFDID